MNRLHGIVIALWFLMLAAVVAYPHAAASPTLGDDETRNTIRLSLLFYFAAVALILTLARGGDAIGQRWARLLWTLAWAAYIVHLGMAFHYYHHWSHADAVAHTRAVSGYGEGIYVSHLFTLLWTLDVAFWWRWPQQHTLRAPWIGRALHAFMAFVVFNATVVYETGWTRWTSVIAFVVLAGLGIIRMGRNVQVSRER